MDKKIKSTLKIQTDLIPSIEIPIEAQLKKPELVVLAQMDFDRVQVGHSVARSLKLFNPT
jgi:hypothetical protein